MKLNILNASNNNLSTIPRVVFKFSTLEKLDLSFNFVEDLSPCLCFLTCLMELNVSNNVIHSYGLGCSIKNLVNLTALDLSDNKMSFLLPRPPQPWEYFACLTALTRLELKGNEIRELPWEWGSMSSIHELSISLKSSTLPEVLAAWSECGIQGIVDIYAEKTRDWLAIQYSGKILNDTSILQSAIQCKTPGDTLAMDEIEPTVHKQSLVSLVRILEESEFANQSALLEYKYLLSSTSEWHIPGLFLSLSQVKAMSDPDPTETVSKKMSANSFSTSQNTEPKIRSQGVVSLSKKQFYASGSSASRKDASSAIFIDAFSQIPSVGRVEDMSRHASLLQESGKIWGTHVPSKPNLDEVLEAIESIDSIGHNLLFGDGQGHS
jgi:hypothetical protein